MDYVELLNMGLNQMKTVYDIYPPNVGLTFKNKRKHTVNTWASTLTTTWGTGVISKSQNGPQGQKAPNTTQQLYTYTGHCEHLGCIGKVHLLLLPFSN